MEQVKNLGNTQIPTWDYRGADKYGFPYLQSDWNQTLVTMINASSAKISKQTKVGGGNAIEVHPVVYHIITDLVYFNEETQMLSGRYHVTVNEDMPQNIIKVSRKEIPGSETIIKIVNL